MITSDIMYVWDIKTNECIYSKETSVHGFRDAAASPDGKNIVFCHDNETITICDRTVLKKSPLSAQTAHMKASVMYNIVITVNLLSLLEIISFIFGKQLHIPVWQF